MKTILFLITLLPAVGQAQSFCDTRGEYTTQQKRILLDTRNQKMVIDRSYTVRVIFHLVRSESGKGGQDVAVIPKIMSNLQTIFMPHQIYFKNTGHDEIRSDYLMAYINDKFDSLTRTNEVQDAINIYLLDDSTYNNGRASIPGRAFVIGGMKDRKPLVTSLGLTHEMGHCLGLLHTYDAERLEKADGSDCDCAGDWVCDTPVDCDDFTVGADCKWIEADVVSLGRRFYSISDPTNNMTSVEKPECYKHLTNGQGELMRKTLGRSPVLKPVWQ
jgi:hypothetical protein